MKRLVWADLIRVIAISSVIMVHALANRAVSEPTNLILNFIFTLAKTGVPLFLMLSGALLLPKKEPLNVFFKKRFLRIFIPWSLWALIFFFIYQDFSQLGLFSAIQNFKEFMISRFTYLPMIMSIYLLVPIFRLIVQKGEKWLSWYLVLLWFLGISLLPQLRNSLAFPLKVDNGLVRLTINYSGYLFLGYLLNKDTFLNDKKVLIILAFLTSWLASWRLNQVNYISPLMIILSASLFYLLKLLADLKLFSFQKNKLKKLLAVLSQASFGVFLVHQFILDWLQTSGLISFEKILIQRLAIFSGTWLLSYGLILITRFLKKFK